MNFYSYLFAYIKDLYYLCTANLRKILQTTKRKEKKMKKILCKIPYPMYKDFRKAVMERLNWSADKWSNHHQGRTKLSESERMALEAILVEVKKGK